MPRDVIPPELTRHLPEVLLTLNEGQFNKNLRSAKRGAARSFRHDRGAFAPFVRSFRGPPILRCSRRNARGQVPESIETAVKLGRMTALSKADGGVRGIVDVIWRLVARTMSQISHVLQGLTELNPNATILSVDGMSAYDTISRRAMLQGLSNFEGGRSALPFVSMFYGSPSQYLWEDERGVTHTIHQGEGGEEGDAMMSLLYSLGQHRALQLVQDELREDEALLAFLDDTHLVTSPERTTTVFATLQGAPLTEAGIRLNPGKTKIWNSAGVKLQGATFCRWLLKHLTRLLLSGEGQGCPHSNRGMKVLETPLGPQSS